MNYLAIFPPTAMQATRNNACIDAFSSALEFDSPFLYRLLFRFLEPETILSDWFRVSTLIETFLKSLPERETEVFSPAILIPGLTFLNPEVRTSGNSLQLPCKPYSALATSVSCCCPFVFLALARGSFSQIPRLTNPSNCLTSWLLAHPSPRKYWI